MKEQTTNKVLQLKSLTKSTVWDVQENDIFRMLDAAEKDADTKDNLCHYAGIIRSAFMIEELKDDNKELKEKYTRLGYKVGNVKMGDDSKLVWAVKKRPITRVTDLTYENVRHITAAKLMEVLDRNFGGGWDSLSQSIKDIIESGFDISTTTLPRDRMHKKGGMYEKKVADGYEVLEIQKGAWVEAIFAKMKPESVKPRLLFDEPSDPDDEEDDLPEDTYNKPDEDDDIEIEEPDDDEINENNYRTTFDIDTEGDDDAESYSDYLADD